jgi:hypothetical protein
VRPGSHLPALDRTCIAPAELQELAREAGLTPEKVTDLEWLWSYPDLETALRGWLSEGMSTLAIAAAGEQAVRTALTNALAPFR